MRLRDENEQLRRTVETRSKLLLDVEGALLAHWTDIPQSEVQRLTAAIRSELGNWEPTDEPKTYRCSCWWDDPCYGCKVSG